MADVEFDWNEYLNFARSLVDLVSGEASVRTSSSRAYYAAYWKARLILEANLVVLPRSNIHRFVWDAFMNSWNTGGASLGKLGDRLKSFRVKADYFTSPPMTQADAEIAVRNEVFRNEDLNTISEEAQAAARLRAIELTGLPQY